MTTTIKSGYHAPDDPTAARVLAVLGDGGMDRWHVLTLRAVLDELESGRALTLERFMEIHDEQLRATRDEIIALREFEAAAFSGPAGTGARN